jgi:hypothetical protein
MALPLALPVVTVHPIDSGSVAPLNLRLSGHLQAVLTRLGIQQKELGYWWNCSHQFASMVLSGEKPLTDERIAQLPGHIQAEMAQAWCEDFGLLVGPRAAAADALVAFARLLGLHERPLPERAGPPVKATLERRCAERRRA